MNAGRYIVDGTVPIRVSWHDLNTARPFREDLFVCRAPQLPLPGGSQGKLIQVLWAKTVAKLSTTGWPLGLA